MTPTRGTFDVATLVCILTTAVAALVEAHVPNKVTTIPNQIDF